MYFKEVIRKNWFFTTISLKGTAIKDLSVIKLYVPITQHQNIQKLKQLEMQSKNEEQNKVGKSHSMTD